MRDKLARCARDRPGRTVPGGSLGPLVVGGHADDIERLLGSAPAAVREVVAGSFTAAPRTLTAAGVRDLAAVSADTCRPWSSRAADWCPGTNAAGAAR